jgi:hypothetical protein
VVERIARPFHPARAALHGDAFVETGLVLAELRQVVQIILDVIGDEDVKLAVVVIINEGRAG